MKFNFLGGQHKGFSPNQNTQETVNMFLEVDSSEENKLTLYRVDGKKDFIELPKSPITTWPSLEVRCTLLLAIAFTRLLRQ